MTMLRIVAAALALLLTGCPIAGLEVPVGTASLTPDKVDRLEFGRSTRADVRATFGTSSGHAGEAYDYFAIPTGRNATQMVVLFPVPFILVAPLPVGSGVLHEGDARVLARYDATGVLADLRWEHGSYADSPAGLGIDKPPSGPLLADAHGRPGSVVRTRPEDAPKPRLRWTAQAVAADPRADRAILVDHGRLELVDMAVERVVRHATLPADCPHDGGWSWDADGSVTLAKGQAACRWQPDRSSPPEPTEMPAGLLPPAEADSYAAWARSPDGRLLVLARIGFLKVLRLQPDGTTVLETVLLLPPAGDPPGIPHLAFAADGSRLAADSGAVVVWDTGTWQEVFRLVVDADGKAGGVPAGLGHGLALSRDGRLLLTGGGVWPLPPPEPAEASEQAGAGGAG